MESEPLFRRTVGIPETKTSGTMRQLQASIVAIAVLFVIYLMLYPRMSTVVLVDDAEYHSSSYDDSYKCKPVSNSFRSPINESVVAFTVTTQASLPRAYHMGFETFFKNNPKGILYVYGGLQTIDERFKSNGFDVRLMPLDIQDLQRQLSQRIPEIEKDVFQKDLWKNTILAKMESTIMVKADFVRLSLLFLHGGTWIDADAIYIRAFSFVNAIPCHDKVTVPVIQDIMHPWLQCDADHRVHRPFDPSIPFIQGRTMYCTNGLLGGFQREHPFLRKVLLRMVLEWPADGITQVNVALGGQLITNTLAYTFLPRTANEPAPYNVLEEREWPNIYPLARLFGAFDVGELSQQFNGDVSQMLNDLERRNVYSMQVYSWRYNRPDVFRQSFEPGTLLRALWDRNCVFSCNDPFE